MPEKKKPSVGQQFVKLLDDMSKSKDKLLDLACAIIKHSPSHRGLKNRDLPDEETAVKMKAAVARFNAAAGKDVSTDGMLAMIANTYRQEGFGNPKKFKEDFKKKYPKEYENADAQKPNILQAAPKLQRRQTVLGG